MKRRHFLALASAAAAFPRVVFGQQAAKVPRIVYLSTPAAGTNEQTLIQGLADFGYVDGKNIALEFVYAPTIDAMPEYAAKVVAGKPDIIATVGSPAPLAVEALTTTIPLLFNVQDPVSIGLVSNYARPGGNVTGTMNLPRDLIVRQLQIIQDILPSATRFAEFDLPADPNYPFWWDQVNAGASALHMTPVRLDAVEGDDLHPLFQRAKDAGCQAAHFMVVNYFNSAAQTLADLCLQDGLPSVGRDTNARAGMLVGYFGSGFNMDPNVNSLRRLAYYVDLILKGSKPGDIPVEGPTNFAFVLNLKTAKALGITIPQSVLLQATEIIE